MGHPIAPMPSNENPPSCASGDFIRAVHYFGDQWPLNFWSSFTRANVEKDFAQIKEDGFNCVILLLPMRIFMPAKEAIAEAYSEKLVFLLSKAENAGLEVILRIGYPYDITPCNTDIAPRLASQFCLSLHQDVKTYNAYIEHLHYVKSLISKSKNIRHVFLSWEDAWCAMKTFPTLDIVKRKMLSKRLGFDRFVRQSIPDEIRKLLGLVEEKVVPIPKKDDPLFAVYKKFYDAYVYEKFIAPLEELFPNSAYEQRVDGQKVIDYKGKEQWVNFSGYGDKKVACFSYWAPFIGQSNKGEVIDAQSAIKALKRVESRIRHKANRKHFIDQFNFVNGTAEFALTSAKINPDELTEFLGEALDYLRETTVGYGLWAYRDYRESYIVNGTFENGMYNWEVAGSSRIAGNGPYWLAVKGDCRLKTRIFASKIFSKFDGYYGPFRLTFSFDRLSLNEAAFDNIQIVANIFGNDYPVDLVKGSTDQSVIMEFGYAGIMEYAADLEIRISVPKGATLKIRDFQFYNHVLSNGLYSFANNSSSAMDAIRRFNRAV